MLVALNSSHAFNRRRGYTLQSAKFVRRRSSGGSDNKSFRFRGRIWPAMSDGDLPTNGGGNPLIAKEIFRHLFYKGDGQTFGERSELHGADARRPLNDLQIWTHAFFILDFIISVQNMHLEVLLLTVITVPLSFLYHWTYERPGKLAQIESTAAKSSFIYGLIQIFYAPSHTLAGIELACAIITTFVFLLTNIRKELYDPWHCLLHVFPAIWVAIVASSHTQLYVSLLSAMKIFGY